MTGNDSANALIAIWTGVIIAVILIRTGVYDRFMEWVSNKNSKR